jgi:hypothetical protein
MTAAYADAENALSKEIVRLEGLIGLRDILRDVGSLEQAANEARTRLESARLNEAAAQAELDAIQRRVESAKAAAASEIAEAQGSADSVLTQAKVAASAIVAGAKAEAAKIISEAEISTADARKRAQVLSDAIKQAGST